MTDDDLIQRLRSRAILDADPHPGRVHACAPASLEAVTSAETRVGFPLPPLLRRLYLEVGNGGYGPGFGLFGVEGGHVGDIVSDAQTVDEIYCALVARGPWWPSKLLPICDWGCGVWSCLDCGSTEGSIVTQVEEELWAIPFNLRSWLEAWLEGADLDGELFEPGVSKTIINPFTRKPTTTQGHRRPKGTRWTAPPGTPAPK